MAVFTAVSDGDLQAFLKQYSLGQLSSFEGIKAGIENSNFFLNTSTGSYVLTIFERLSAQELPFYLGLTEHLGARAIACPAPLKVTSGPSTGATFSSLHGKPAAIVQRLKGKGIDRPLPLHCKQIGELLARMHLAAQDYAGQLPNLRGLSWWVETAPKIEPFLNGAQRDLLSRCLREQVILATQADYARIPRAAVHADLFRDNALFHNDLLGGPIDFYFAGVDTLLFDLAVTANDWCIDLATGRFDHQRLAALLSAYQTMRPLSATEITLWPAMQRAAALRFWISRLFDFYLPRAAQQLTPHNPLQFENILRERFIEPHLLAA
jgi:homoserine kinase type II